MKKNEIHRAVIAGCTSEGQGVARLHGRAVFVPGTARGDECLLRIVKAGPSGPAYAKLEELLVPSPARQTPECPVHSACGGCHFQHISYGEELALKAERVRDAFARIGKLALPIEEIISAPDTSAYRNKALLPVRDTGGGPVTGFFRARSHDVVPVDRCGLQSDEAGQLSEALLAWMRAYRVPAYDEASGEGLVRHLFVRVAGGGEALCCIVATAAALPRTQELVTRLRAACPALVGIVLQTNTRRDNVVLSGPLYTLWGRDFLEDTLCGLRFRLSVTSFYQVNRAQAERLYERAAAYAALRPGETLLDLYCGVGTLTLYLGQKASRAFGVEIAPEAVQNARENAALNNMRHVTFLEGDASDAAAHLRADGVRPDVVTVDPPRSGLDAALIHTVAEMAPSRVVYISCDPATLARDLSRFGEQGYGAETCTIVDMFPRTAHVETVVLLSHKKPDGHINVKVEFGEGEGKVPLDKIVERAQAYKPKERVTYKMIKEPIE